MKRTYTIRRPGHVAWVEGIQYGDEKNWPNLERTKAALEAYDEALEAFQKAFEVLDMEDTLEALNQAEREVGEAFAADTADRNPPDTARLMRPCIWLRDLVDKWQRMERNKSQMKRTYTIRRPGHVAWVEGIQYEDVADALREANDVVPGHVAIEDATGEMVSPREDVEITSSGFVGPMQRDDQDVVGAGLDAANRLLNLAKNELQGLAQMRAQHAGAAWSLEQMLHAVLCAWLDEHIDAGVLTEADVEPDVDRACSALARLEALRLRAGLDARRYRRR